jgi:uncharacterized protein (UPF0303 family)
MEPAEAISPPPIDLGKLLALEASLLFRTFTSDTAFMLGTHLRNRLRVLTPLPAVVNITLANSQQLLFHACTHPGTPPDYDNCVARKRRTVLRWAHSSYFLGRAFKGDERVFAEEYGLGAESGEYTIQGGAVPVRVCGVEGIVAVVVVTGLSEEENHMVAVEGMEDCIREMQIAGPLKK